MTIVLIGTLDTKGAELGWVREILHRQGLATITVDVGSLGAPTIAPDIPRAEVLRQAGATESTDRGVAVAAMTQGVARLVADLHRAGRVDGVFSLGGSAGTVIGSSAMRALPFGVPKVLVSTLASGQTRPFVEGSDIALFFPVADLAGLNRLTRTALSNAAHALAGMVRARADQSGNEWVNPTQPKLIAATMFGVTTRCVDRARETLTARAAARGQAVEVVVFHATGVGGQAMETLIRAGEVTAVLDLTTTELADELVGGILSSGPDRLKAAVAGGLPQVVSVGALDMVNFGPRPTVPDRFAGRTFHIHNPSVTLMRTTPAENAELGARMARILARATVPTWVLLPLGGLSAIDQPGSEWHDSRANDALFAALRSGLAHHPWVQIAERPEAINDPAFADEAARLLDSLLT